MRVIQLKVARHEKETVKEVLEAEDVSYVTTDATSEEGAVVVIQFPIPRQAVEHVLEELRDAGINVDGQYRVSLRADVARTESIDTLIERFVKGTADDDYIAREELESRARDMNPSVVTYYTMTLLGVVVATSGLLLNSPAVVVGSMVLAPQLGAALMASVGIVVNDREMIVRGLASQVAGLALGLLGSVAFGAVVRSTMVVTPVLDITALAQISGRTAPGPLTVAIGVAAGVAAVFGLVAHDSPSGPLVGVMVSAALIPAAATAGLGISWGRPRAAIGALVLLVVNVVSINLSGPVVLWLLGYRPEQWGDGTREVAHYAPSLLAGLLLLGGLVVSGAVLSQQISYEYEVKSSVTDVLDSERYRDIELRKVSTRYVDLGLVDSPQQVVIVISQSSNRTHPELDATLQRRVANDTGVDVTVLVEYRNRSSTNRTSPVSALPLSSRRPAGRHEPVRERGAHGLEPNESDYPERHAATPALARRHATTPANAMS
jgi:uncharacterized hydrophobic protein (TIGR00341 family)